MTVSDVATLCLDEENHKAFLGRRELIRATTALADVGIVDTRWFTPESRERGSHVHHASRAFFAGAFDYGEVITANEWPYMEGIVRFVEETGFQCQRCEEPIYDEAAGYAGRYDLFGTFPYLPTSCDDLIDIKTGRAAEWVMLQTIGYARRARVDGRPCRRWALELPGDGRYRLLPLNLSPQKTVDRAADRQHEEIFLSCVRVSRFKRGL